MTTLMCQMPNPTDATSLYRGLGPLQALRRTGTFDRFELAVGGLVNWASLKNCDAVFVQRPAKKDHVRIVDMAKANKKKVWIDYDDWLYGVPFSNKTHRIYNDPNTQNYMSEMIAKADVVSVSTPYLGRLVQSILARIAKGAQSVPGLILDPEKVVVVPNAYDLDLMSDLSDASKQPHQNKLVAWRGSGTHDKDLLGVTENLVRVIEKHLDWTYNFIGEPFWLSIERLEKIPGIRETNIQLTETIDPIDYLGFLKTVAPALMIVPLEDGDFNRSKSNIAWLEATHAGAVTLAPDFDEWRKPGVITYKNAEDFERKLDDFLRGEYDAERAWRLSRDYILENLTLDRVNGTREEIVRRLTGRM